MFNSKVCVALFTAGTCRLSWGKYNHFIYLFIFGWFNSQQECDISRIGAQWFINARISVSDCFQILDNEGIRNRISFGKQWVLH